MTLPTGASARPDAKPISVKATAAPVVLSESTKVVLVAFFTYALAQMIHSDVALAAILPAVGILVTWFWGLWHRIRCWGALRFLAGHVDDSIAKVGK